MDNGPWWAKRVLWDGTADTLKNLKSFTHKLVLEAAHWPGLR